MGSIRSAIANDHTGESDVTDVMELARQRSMAIISEAEEIEGIVRDTEKCLNRLKENHGKMSSYSANLDEFIDRGDRFLVEARGICNRLWQESVELTEFIKRGEQLLMRFHDVSPSPVPLQRPTIRRRARPDGGRGPAEAASRAEPDGEGRNPGRAAGPAEPRTRDQSSSGSR